VCVAEAKLFTQGIILCRDGLWLPPTARGNVDRPTIWFKASVDHNNTNGEVVRTKALDHYGAQREQMDRRLKKRDNHHHPHHGELDADFDDDHSSTNGSKPCCQCRTLVRVLVLTIIFAQFAIIARLLSSSYHHQPGGPHTQYRFGTLFLRNSHRNINEVVPSSVTRTALTGAAAQSSAASSTPIEIPAKRLLFMLASNSMDQFLYLQKTLDCMRDICNAGWNVTVHMSVSGEFSMENPRYQELLDRAYCVRNQEPIRIIMEQYPENMGFGLNSRHRLYLQQLYERALNTDEAFPFTDHFDYVSYAEEDMLLTISHLNAFMAAEAALQREFPSTWMQYVPGFLRYSLRDQY
jgi:hypothetical protein